MGILDEIYAELESLKTNKERVVVGIAGAGCIGKTTIANKLVELMHPHNVQIINLDGYMLERKEAYKIEPGMTGYDVRRNDLELALEEIGNLVLNKETVHATRL